ncbi:MAG: hypothetical protein JWQ10_1781, partial [Herbaspirillum sp.]|nr:hypothetical protein [Herbaspirillum sp.]
SYYDPATGHLLAADSTVPFPEAFSGTVVRLRNAAGTGVSEYVKIETAYIDAPNDILLTTRFMPFFSYRDIDGALVGQFALGGLRHSFRADGRRILGASHQPVSIYRTTSDEINKLQKYQELLEFKYDIERINYRSILKFTQLRAPRQQQFELVLDRAEMLLRDAVEVLNTQADIARKICARFAADDAQAATEVMNAVREKLENMLQSFPFFRSQVSNVVGFFTNVRSSTGIRQDSFSIPDSMAYQMDFRHMDKTLINFRLTYFNDARQLKDNQAGLVLRAYSVASVGTMNMARGDVIWSSTHAKDSHGKFTLKTLMETARTLGCPASNSLIVEHIAMLLAYTRRPETSASIEAFLNGADYYYRPFSNSDFDVSDEGIYDPGQAAAAPVGGDS